MIDNSSRDKTFNRVVVVLGNRLIIDGVHEELKGRMDTAIKLWSSLENSLMLVSGGKTNPSIRKTEAEAMKEYAVSKGVPAKVVLTDNDAMDTVGNAYFTRRILDFHPRVKFVYTVTSCYHIERTEYIFSACLGPKFKLDCKTCFNSARQTAESEKKSLTAARILFSEITPGDIDWIESRLRERHSLYHNLVS